MRGELEEQKNYWEQKCRRRRDGRDSGLCGIVCKDGQVGFSIPLYLCVPRHVSLDAKSLP